MARDEDADRAGLVVEQAGLGDHDSDDGIVAN